MNADPTRVAALGSGPFDSPLRGLGVTFSFRRVLAVLAILLAAGWVFDRVARATDPAAPPAVAPDGGVPIEIEKADGTKLAGTSDFAVLRLKASYGTVELDIRKVKQLDLTPNDDGTIAAAVMLMDKSHLSGTLFPEPLAVTIDGTPTKLNGSEIAVLKFKHPKDPSLWAAIIGLVTLTFMEIVLGVDNVIFLAILAGKLPEAQRPRARTIGLIAALGTRLGLLASLSFLLGLTKSIFTLPALPFLETPEARGVSWRDILLIAGGLFLIGKSTLEIHEKLNHANDDGSSKPVKPAGFVQVILMIAVIDIVFSLDSVITAVGMVDELWVMIVAMVIAMLVMLAFAGPISRFVERRPTVKMLALSFLILIGVMLVAESLGQHMDKGYIYFAMAFAMVVEVVNMRLRKAASTA